MKVIKNVNVGDEELVLRTISTTPKEHYDGKWKPGRLYPLFSVVENNGTTFVSQNAKMKEEPYVIYDAAKQEFKANDGWKIKKMSADSRLTALGGGPSGGGGVTPQDVAEMVAGKQDKINDLATIRSGAAAGATAYQKPDSGIPKNDLASAVQTSLGKADTAYQKPSGGIPASDLANGVIPDVPTISTDISADANSNTKTASPKAVKDYVDNHSGSGTDPEAVKFTSQSLSSSQKEQARSNIGAGTYSKPSGGIPASDLANGVVPDVSGLYTKPASGIPASDLASGVIPDVSGKQDALVSGTNIKTINQTSILGSGDITIEDGVGFESIETPQTPDGTVSITLTNGDTITLSLNHEHPQYLKYVMLTDESEMPANPDPTTLYMWPEAQS